MSGLNGHLCLTLAATALIRMVERFSMTAPAHEAGKACMNHLSGVDALTVVQVVRRSSEIARRPACRWPQQRRRPALPPRYAPPALRAGDQPDAAGRSRGEGPRLLRSQAPVTRVRAGTKPACLPEPRRAGLPRSQPARSQGGGWPGNGHCHGDQRRFGAVRGRARGAHPLDERRPRLRRGFGGADRGHPAQHRGNRPGRAARAAQGGRALAAHRLRMRPGAGRGQLHRVVAQGRPGRTRPVRAGGRGLDPERGHQARGLLVRVRQQPRHRPADDHQRVAGPARAEGHRDPRRGDLRHLRWHPRDGRQPDRRHGGARLPRLGLAVQGRAADRLRARLPHPPGQPLRDHPLPALPGGRARPR